LAAVERALTTSWLAARLAVDPMRLHALRRSGELLAYRPPGSQEYLFPAWQFDADWRPLPVVARLVAAAREAGIGDERLLELLGARVGIGGSERLQDLARSGDADAVVAALKSAF
jgi:nucleotide-binding universal stress UspA family protein